tara:strand:+ start:440 stop:2215 length:1776 start_codon:yes stop_codon:yes gene_type:complete
MVRLLSKITTVFVCVLIPASIVAQDTLLISWAETPGLLESTIQADTTNDGSQAHDVYLLEANRIYLQRTELNVNSHVNITGQTPADGEFPATIQPMPGADGLSGFTGWPNGNFQVYGDGANFTMRNLILNGASIDQGFNLGSVVTARGDLQKIVMDNVVASHYVTFTFSTFGTSTDFHLNNSVVKAFTNGPGGQYFGGLSWGGGSWMGTIDTLVVQHSTVHNVIGECIVVYGQVDHGLVDHNTFANIVMGVIWYRGQNNMTVSNNLFYNTKSHGQSAYDISGWGVWHPGGQGQMSVMPEYTHPDSTLMVGADVADHMNRNINYHNNVWWHDEHLTGFMEGTDPWSWEASSTSFDTLADGTIDTIVTTTTVHDTMLALAHQSKWNDDSTLVTLDQGRGVSQSNNINSDPGINLDDQYIITQLARTWDFRDNLTSDTPPFDTQWWQYEPDGSHISIEWPMSLDMSYDPTSAAATASATGGPVGDPRWMQSTVGIDNDVNVPKEFTLKQNYPNPFNPTTDISFTIGQTSDINLTIYNLLGQKVRVLENASRQAGTHTLRWDGRDQMGQDVSTGVYLYTLTNGTKSITKKMALMK